jgi:hypothetical protein
MCADEAESRFRDVPSLIPPPVDDPQADEAPDVNLGGSGATSVKAVASSTVDDATTTTKEADAVHEHDRALNGDLGTWLGDICDKNIGSMEYNYLLEEKLDEKHAFLLDGAYSLSLRYQ